LDEEIVQCDEEIQSKIGDLHKKLKPADDIHNLINTNVNGFLKASFLKPSTFMDLNDIKGTLQKKSPRFLVGWQVKHFQFC
jgi:hypothetical protein